MAMTARQIIETRLGRDLGPLAIMPRDLRRDLYRLALQLQKENPVKTRDEAIRDMADRATDQCEALANKLTAVIDGEDDGGETELEGLCGISRDGKGRACLIFAEHDPSESPRTVVYVDDILALAKLLNGEVQVQYE